MSEEDTSGQQSPIHVDTTALSGLASSLSKTLGDFKVPNPMSESFSKAVRDATSGERIFDLPSGLVGSDTPNPFSEQDNYTRRMIEDQEERNRQLQLMGRRPWHQLIVIGNGFDLECKLPSGFGSFLKARKQALGDNADGCENPLWFTKTIWDVILDNLGDAAWCDVEGAIAKWVVSDSGRSLFQETLLKVKDAQSQNCFGYDPNKPEDMIALYLHEAYPDLRGGWSKEELLDLTHRDLAAFEREFARYLSHAVETTDGYSNRALQLMSEIMFDELPSKNDYDIENSVLSFNYTRPLTDLWTNRGQKDYERRVNYVNIHGRLDKGEIVFGIDATGHTDDVDVLPFTKTYRLMALDVPDTGTLIHIPEASRVVRDYGTAMIKFYGHSLGEADYSYFQAIFDSVKLYEGQTRLIFYYRSYGGKSAQDVQVETMRRVIHLLKAYSRTLDNEAHGRNLIHKLLIEGRLSVKELPKNVRQTA